jgi:hypothetical protein
MFPSMSRRDFVRASIGAGALAGVGSFAFLNRLPPAEAAQEQAGRRLAPVSEDLDPLVRMIEETPRERILQAAAERIQAGTGYQDLLAGVMLAGVRGIEPRPVGFKFHAVMAVHAAHMTAMAASDRDRWLPLFWALDYFKNSQARNAREGDWGMAPADETRLPPAHQAPPAFPGRDAELG